MTSVPVQTLTDERPDSPFAWPTGFPRIPDEPWVVEPLDELGLNYDAVGSHGWYKNLEPTISQILATLDEDQILVDFSAGTGILAKRLLDRINYAIGILNIDSSPKFLRVGIENVGSDERAAFRLIRFLRDQKRLQLMEEVCEQPLLDRGADVLAATNAIHLYYDLPETLRSWHRVLRPGGLVFICSANMRNPNARPSDWIIDETVESVNEIAAELVLREPAFEQYRPVLQDSQHFEAHKRLRQKVFVPVRELDYYLDVFTQEGFEVVHTFDTTIFADVEEWLRFLHTYHDGVMSWVGGSPKIDGRTPTEQELRDRRFLIRYGLERLFADRSEFPATWTYITARRR